MRLRILCVTTVLLGLICLGATAGFAAPKLSVPIMKSSEIKPGMKGYGLTVFKGTEPEKFDVEVVDVLQKIFPKHDLILVKCSHPIIDKAKIIQGMSGSPIYIDGKLIGALAYGWGFSKDALAGVTPIEWMLEEMEAPKANNAEPKGASGSWSSPRRMTTDDKGRDMVSREASENAPAGDFSVPELTRLQIPVQISGLGGLPPRAMAEIRKRFAAHGMTVMQGAGGGSVTKKIGVDSLKPGSPLGVSLMRGDISVTGIGTLTHREGNRIIAFGHPMLFGGQELAMPLTTAYIHGVMPSEWTSFKFGSPSESVGTLTQDRWPAIAGTLGKKCPMVDLVGEVVNPETGHKEAIKCEMVRDRSLTPSLVFMASAYMMLLQGAAYSDFAVEYEFDVEFEDHKPLHLEGMDMAWAGFMVSDPAMVASEVLDNPFSPMKPTKMRLSLKPIHKRIEGKIQRAWLEQLEVPPGSTVKLHLQVQPFGSEPKEISFPITIPAHLEEGLYKILVGGGSNWSVQQPTPPAESVDDIFTRLQKRYLPTTAVAVLELPSVGVGFKGQLFEQLPSSVFGTLVSSSSAGVSTFQDAIRVTHDTEWYLTGWTQRLKIVVKQSAEEK